MLFFKNSFLKKELSKEDIAIEERLNNNLSSEKFTKNLNIIKREIEKLKSEINKIENERTELKEIERKQTDLEEIEKLLKTDKINSKKYVRSIIDQITIYPEPDKKMSSYSNDNCFKLILKIQRQYFTIYMSQRSKSYEPIFPDYAKYKEFFKEYGYQPILLK